MATKQIAASNYKQGSVPRARVEGGKEAKINNPANVSWIIVMYFAIITCFWAQKTKTEPTGVWLSATPPVGQYVKVVQSNLTCSFNALLEQEQTCLVPLLATRTQMVHLVGPRFPEAFDVKRH